MYKKYLAILIYFWLFGCDFPKRGSDINYISLQDAKQIALLECNSFYINQKDCMITMGFRDK